MRRHLLGLLLALGLLAMLFFGTAWGIDRIEAAGGPVTTTHGLIAVGVVAATGLMLGVLLVAPAISPLATGLPGLILLGWSALLVIGNKYALDVPLRHTHFGAGVNYLLFNGVLGLLGAMMIVPMAVPSRWRSRREYVDEADDDDDYSVHTALGLIP